MNVFVFNDYFQMPISHAKTLLGFGPNENYLFINFCETHGIITNPIKNMITLNKKHLMEPDTPIINREPFLIEFKLNVPVIEFKITFIFERSFIFCVNIRLPKQ